MVGYTPEKAQKLFKNLLIPTPDDKEWYVFKVYGLMGASVKIFLASPQMIDPILPELTGGGAYGGADVESAYGINPIQNMCSIVKDHGAEACLREGVTLETLELEGMEPPDRRWWKWDFCEDPLETEADIRAICRYF